MFGRLGPVATFTIAALIAAGCVATDGKGVPAGEPDIAGKADFVDQISMKGDLELIETEGRLLAEATDSFTEDFEYHGFTLLTQGSAVLRIEVTQRGTSRGLDTSLYVYGPRGDGGEYEQRLGFDDDTGWGQLSRIDGFVPPETGQYLIVVGTYSGLGRGNYRLEVECLSGDCLDVEVPTSCPDRVVTDIHDCVEEWLAEGDYENTRNEAFVACTTDYAGDFYEYACESSYHAPEPWCPAGIDVFLSDIMPACREEVGVYYPEDRPALRLEGRSLGDVITDRLSQGPDWSMGATGESYTVLPPESGEPITFEWILDSVRQISDNAAMYQMEGEVAAGSFGSFAQSYELGDDFIDLLEADAGSDSFRLGKLDANWYCAAGAECWLDLFVFVFDNNVVTTIEFAAGED